MIVGIFHSGSGLGNQLHRYVATRVLAMDKGHDFTMVAPENFKGISFMKLDTGKPIDILYHTEMPAGKVVADIEIPLWEEGTRYYNPEFNFIEDNTIIDGEFQDERYFEHRLKEVDGWLKVEPVDIPDDVCVIGFRGGEYVGVPELFIPSGYWDEAIEKMRQINPDMKFEVHTDDQETAKAFFPDFPIIQNIGINWRSMRYAKHAIIANSSFYILPRLLNSGITIAPRYWARYNIREWSMPQNYYKNFTYIHHENF
jgi:hypothetical protein